MLGNASSHRDGPFMKKALSLYGDIARPWLCAVVYLWALEFQSVYASDFEPLLDRLADASTILLALIFWTLLICAGVALIGLLWPRARVSRINQFVVRIFCLLISGFFLVRWMNGWAPRQLTNPAIQWFGILAVAAAYWLVRQRRQRSSAASVPNLFFWRDCFYFGALPLLVALILVLGRKIGTSVGFSRTVIASNVGKSPDHQAEPHLPNVIVIVSDSLRAQSMSVYGNSAVSTPSLERFAADSSVYLETHANSTTTTPSMTALLTGKHPFSHGRLSREIAPRADENNLLHVLRSHGYSTAAVTSNVEAAFSSLALSSELTSPESFMFRFLPVSGLRDRGVYPTLLGNRMYEDLSLLFPFLGLPRRTSLYGDIDDTLSRAREVVTRMPEPFFLFIHIHEPHESYSFPSLFSFARGLARKFTTGFSNEAAFYYTQYNQAFQPTVDGYREAYEASVRRVDSELGKFLAFLANRSLLDGSLLVVTGDHGESFERGYLGHGEELYESSTRVPLIIRFPNQKAGERVAGMTQLIDIAPTIVRALAIPTPDWMDGKALIPGTSPENLATVTINFKHPDENGFYPLPTKVAIWREPYKLIVNCAPGGEELYDLKSDPEEQINLATQRPALVDDLKRELKLQMAKQQRQPVLVCPDR
jgi:arylsulfatase A-like enzyme